jgi:uncharacterized protein (DUF433 family)
MNRMVDEDLVPDLLVGQRGGMRLFTRLCAAFARFYFDTQDLLVATARRQIVEELTQRVGRLQARDDVLALTRLPQDMSWKVARCAVEIDVTPYVAAALARAREVDQADALVSVDPEVMGGEPVFAGSRVPIDIVLGSVDTGVDQQRLQDSYPFLTPLHLVAARVWREVHPRRGRPRRLAQGQPAVTPRSPRVVRGAAS